MAKSKKKQPAREESAERKLVGVHCFYNMLAPVYERTVATRGYDGVLYVEQKTEYGTERIELTGESSALARVYLTAQEALMNIIREAQHDQTKTNH